MQYSELKTILDSYTDTLLGKYPHRYITFDLTCKANSTLRDMLLEDGYWDFAPHRSSKLVGYHQIVAFYCTQHPQMGGDMLEVHHIDGKTTNNHPSNLMYLSPGDHALVTKYQRRLSKLSLKIFSHIYKGMYRTPFNRRGRTITNWARFILATIALTISKTQAWVKTFIDHSMHTLLLPSLLCNSEDLRSPLANAGACRRLRLKNYIRSITRFLMGIADTNSQPT